MTVAFGLKISLPTPSDHGRKLQIAIVQVTVSTHWQPEGPSFKLLLVIPWPLWPLSWHGRSARQSWLELEWLSYAGAACNHNFKLLQSWLAGLRDSDNLKGILVRLGLNPSFLIFDIHSSRVTSLRVTVTVKWQWIQVTRVTRVAWIGVCSPKSVPALGPGPAGTASGSGPLTSESGIFGCNSKPLLSCQGFFKTIQQIMIFLFPLNLFKVNKPTTRANWACQCQWLSHCTPSHFAGLSWSLLNFKLNQALVHT